MSSPPSSIWPKPAGNGCLARSATPRPRRPPPSEPSPSSNSANVKPGDLIAEYDRPIRRHRHQAQITNARHVLAEVPHQLHPAQQKLTAANDTLADLDNAASASRAVLARRSDIEAEIGDLDDQIADDLRIRTRVTRREQPEAITAVLGSRPAIGQDGRQWDTAAGRLAQHQAAFNVGHGLGRRPDNMDRSAYRDSHEAVENFLQPLLPPAIDRTIAVPDLGLSL